MAGLISGLLAPQRGDIRLGDIRLGGLEREDLSTSRVLIPQEAYVFSGTLAENFTYLRPFASVSDVEGAVDLLGARSLVNNLGGLAAELEPSSLSAGERQLVTLVRACLSPARLIILDEATCHLDPGAEARAERGFARRPGSVVVVLHRMSSALRAEKVLLMDGERTWLGSHTTLLQRSDLYRDLVGYWDASAVRVTTQPTPPTALSAMTTARASRCQETVVLNPIEASQAT